MTQLVCIVCRSRMCLVHSEMHPLCVHEVVYYRIFHICMHVSNHHMEWLCYISQANPHAHVPYIPAHLLVSVWSKQNYCLLGPILKQCCLLFMCTVTSMQHCEGLRISMLCWPVAISWPSHDCHCNDWHPASVASEWHACISPVLLTCI